MSKPWVDVVYCEDIRFEKSGQTSIIGVLPAAIGIPSFPHVIPKLGIWLRVRVERGSRIGSAKLQVVADSGKALADMEISEQDFANQLSEIEKVGLLPGEAESVEIGINCIISPVVFDGETAIRTKLVIDGEEYTCPSMAVRLQASR
ncbi:DUF6941 family protein [Burkholderia gladioli]|uniref:DUF6941 family protein n=1 Tax=Burkholderia gladioli TaxID=28095 RepID=UPI0016421DA9|nr:hypothetical protein [Burkholderia gladioli]